TQNDTRSPAAAAARIAAGASSAGRMHGSGGGGGGGRLATVTGSPRVPKHAATSSRRPERHTCIPPAYTIGAPLLTEGSEHRTRDGVQRGDHRGEDGDRDQDVPGRGDALGRPRRMSGDRRARRPADEEVERGRR